MSGSEEHEDLGEDTKVDEPEDASGEPDAGMCTQITPLRFPSPGFIYQAPRKLTTLYSVLLVPTLSINVLSISRSYCEYYRIPAETKEGPAPWQQKQEDDRR